MAEYARRHQASWLIFIPAFVLIGLTVAIVLMLSGVPGGPATPSGGVAPAPMPLFLSSLSTNNARIGDLFRLTVHTRPQVGVWVLASSNTGPTTIGPWSVDLGPDWFVLRDFAWTSGGNIVELALPIPYNTGMVGNEAVVQALIHDPNSVEWFWTESVVHRFSDAPNGGRSVLLVRQVSGTQEAPHATLQADALAQAMAQVGHDVTVVDDALPADLASFDCIMDCRFTLPPNPVEHDRLVDFLKHYGGVFMLCGPTVGSSFGQWRFAFIQQFVNAHLGMGLTLGTGINQSTGVAGESISINAEPYYLTNPQSVAGMPYRVENEGGSFGPEGLQPVGWPWVVGSAPGGVAPTVYGMLFKPDDIASVPVKGKLAILFNGADDALAPSSQSPFAHMIMTNLSYWLDS